MLWRGAPYGVEPEIEKALGLESSPKTLLTQCLDAEAAEETEALRAALERLVDKAHGLLRSGRLGRQRAR